MARMTEEDANILDEEITNADITLKIGKSGIFMRQRELLDALDRASADYLITRAMATNKMPLQILGEMVHEKIITNSSASAQKTPKYLVKTQNFRYIITNDE
jgi:hypothetical protein